MIEPENRTDEYWFNERYETFLLKEMLPTIEGAYGETAERGLWGASLGGLVSSLARMEEPRYLFKSSQPIRLFNSSARRGAITITILNG